MKTGCWGKLVFYPMPPLAAPRIRTLVRRGERGCGLRRVRHGVAHRPDLARPVQRRGSRNPAENDVRRLLVLLAPKVQEKNFFPAFRCRKAAKSHPTDSDSGVRKTESGVGRLRGLASKPSPPRSLSALLPLFRHRNQVGNRLAGKKNAGAHCHI